MNSKSDNELAEAIQVTEGHDSPAIGGLRLPAQRAASIQLDLNAAALPQLSRWQKMLAFLAGGLGEA